jgi:hypothetical protein
MKNEHSSAYPIVIHYPDGSSAEDSSGLTKLEYAAIHILGSIASHVSEGYEYTAAQKAVRLAKALFVELEAKP